MDFNNFIKLNTLSMSKKDPRIDAYIVNSAEFAKPILSHIRELVHKACPDVEETMKWSFPHFDYKGMMCSMASFKQHCAFGFWKAAIMANSKAFVSKAQSEEAMGHLGKITSLKDLPKDSLMIKYIKEAAKLNEDNVKLPSKAKEVAKKELQIPDDFTKALSKNKKAQKVFGAFSYTNKKDQRRKNQALEIHEIIMMTLTYHIQQPIHRVFQHLADARKFSEVHPVIYKVERISDNEYKFYECMRVLYIPFRFSYHVHIKPFPDKF
jgi:hypothetical protein